MELADWAAVLGNFGEFIGSIAVLITLGYLALQVKHSRALLERQEVIAMSQVYSQRVYARSEVQRAVCERPELAELLVSTEGAESTADLSPAQILQLNHHYERMMGIFDNDCYQAQLGLMDLDPLEIAFLEQVRPQWEKFGVTPNRYLDAWLKSRSMRSA